MCANVMMTTPCLHKIQISNLVPQQKKGYPCLYMKRLRPAILKVIFTLDIAVKICHVFRIKVFLV